MAPKHVKTALLKGTKFDFGWGSAPDPTSLGEPTALPRPPPDPIPLSALWASKQVAYPNMYP